VVSSGCCDFRRCDRWLVSGYLEGCANGTRLSEADRIQLNVGRQCDNRFDISVQRKSSGAEHWVGGSKGFAHPALSKTHTRTSGVSERMLVWPLANS
jgi:hypothetical protein